MRRRPGISGLQRGQQAKAQYKAVGDQATEASLEQMKLQMAGFKKGLEEFASKHRDDIRKNPAFRSQFHKMCANCGVDPLQSNKGMFADLLGIGDFYYELGVQIVEACLATKELNGGLMDIEALLKYVRRRRGTSSAEISEDDVVRSVNKLKVLGGGFSIAQVGKKTLIRSVPGELNRDHNKILELAQHLLEDGLSLLDKGAPDGKPLFWFPCVTEDAM